MDEPPPAHSFVVKVWAKRVEDASQDASWRGSITHVESGERVYLDRLMQVPEYLAPYVIEVGGALDLWTRLYLRLASSSHAEDQS